MKMVNDSYFEINMVLLQGAMMKNETEVMLYSTDDLYETTTTTEDTTTLADDITYVNDEPLDEDKQMILWPLLESCLKLGSEILEIMEDDDFDFLMNITCH